MAKKDTVPQESTLTTYPVTIEEFLSGFGKQRIESRQAFSALMKAEGTTDHQQPEEWSRLFDLFLKKPTSVAWPEWIKQNKGGA